MERWEYLTNTGQQLDTDYLNALGAEGWELVTVYPEGSNTRQVFKRRIVESAAKQEPSEAVTRV